MGLTDKELQYLKDWHVNNGYLVYETPLHGDENGFEIRVQFTSDSLKHFLKDDCGYEDSELRGNKSQALMTMVCSELSKKNLTDF